MGVEAPLTSVGCEDDGNLSFFQKAILPKEVVEQALFCVSIQSTEDVIKQQNLFFCVYSACNSLRRQSVKNLGIRLVAKDLPVELFGRRSRSCRCFRPILGAHEGSLKYHP